MNQLSLFPDVATIAERRDFLDEVRSFSAFGRQTEKFNVDGIEYFVNEYWTSGQRQSHSLHEISYRACFKAQLPQFFISKLTEPGDLVYDPFMGRGTTLVEAHLLGRSVAGNDINPLSKLLTRPRLAPIRLVDVEAALNTVDWTSGRLSRNDLAPFFHEGTLTKIEALRAWLASEAPLDNDAPATAPDWVRMVALNRLTGHSPGFFSGRTMPPNQAVSIEAQIRINERNGLVPPLRDVPAIIKKKSKSLLRDGPSPVGPSPKLLTKPADKTPELADSAVSLVVTSPPFLDIVQYAADNWMRCWFAGIDPDRVEISMHRTEDGWTEMVHRTLRELARVVKAGGYVAFEVGEVRNGKVLLERLVWAAAQGLPFERLGVLVNDQKFTKTANCWGVVNGSKGTNTNRIVILKRE